MINDTVPAELRPTAVGDYDNDGIPDLMVKFNRTVVCELILSEGVKYGNITLTLTGKLLDGTSFGGSGTVRVRMPGDINVDGVVDGSDISLAAYAFGSYGPDFLGSGSPPHPRWNSIADENEDGVVDGRDIVIIAGNFGKTYL